LFCSVISLLLEGRSHELFAHRGSTGESIHPVASFVMSFSCLQDKF
jgi:hypothetical protein